MDTKQIEAARKLASAFLKYNALVNNESLGDDDLIRSVEMWDQMVELAAEVVK